MNTLLKASTSALLILDVQEAIIPSIYEGQKLLSTIELMAEACQCLQIPIYVIEQYPKGLGHTVSALQKHFANAKVFEKTKFSAYEFIDKMPQGQWIIVGMEAHICVLQTVQDLLRHGKEAIVIYDGIGSRTQDQTQMAIFEMCHIGARVTSAESVLYEFLQDSKHPHFKSILELVKKR